MAPPLTVRNLTPGSISLKVLERFEDPDSLQSKPGAFLFLSNSTTPLTPSAPQLGEHAQTFTHQDLDVTLAPFESYTLKSLDDVDGADSSSAIASTKLRLTIQLPNGERYRVDANPSHTQKASQSFTPLTPNPSTNYTALYHPATPTPHLTVHMNHVQNFSKWMSTLPSNLPLSALSIPGTHNSHTYYRALPSVRCQVHGLKTQLENGIRFLDIRVQPSHATDTRKKDLYLVHGAFPISLTGAKYLSPVLQTCYDFLSDNPSETILMSLKREGTGNSTDSVLSQILEEHYIAPNADKWHTNPRIPYLGDARGKLVLVRRYTLHSTSLPLATPSLRIEEEEEEEEGGGGFGLDATTWPHNTSHAHHGPFCIQDFCEILHPTSIPSKLEYSNAHLVRSAACTAFIPGVNTDATNPLPVGPLYLNFCSGSNFWNVHCWPERIAKVVNRGLEEWVCRGHHLRDGGPACSSSSSSAHLGTGGNVAVSSSVNDDGDDGDDDDDDDDDDDGAIRRAKDGDGGAGVVVMDCVGEGGDWDLVRLIVGLNMGVLKRVEDSSRS